MKYQIQTHHLINEEAFAKMKDDVVLVNTRSISSSYSTNSIQNNPQPWWDCPSTLLDQSSWSQEDVGSRSWRFWGWKKVRPPLFLHLHSKKNLCRPSFSIFILRWGCAQVHISWPVKEWFPRWPSFGPVGTVWPCHTFLSHRLLHRSGGKKHLTKYHL